MRLKGPLHSIDASGTFAKVLTFSKNQRANFAYFKPNVARAVYSPLTDPHNKCLYNAAYWLYYNVLSEDDRAWWNALGEAGSGLIKFFWYNAGALDSGDPVRTRKDPEGVFVEDPTDAPPMIYGNWDPNFPAQVVAFTDFEPTNQRGHFRQYHFKARFVPSLWPPGDPVPPEYFTDWTEENIFNCPCTDFRSWQENTGFYNLLSERIFFPANQYWLVVVDVYTCTGNSANINYYLYYHYPTRTWYYHYY